MIKNILDIIPSNYKNYKIKKIDKEASGREYYRLFKNKRSFILMDSSKEKDAFFDFLKIYKILSKVNINNNLVISNQNFKEINIENINNLMEVINSLKIIYENHWKKINQINTSIKLTLNIYLNSKNYKLINGFENFLRSLDLVSNYYIDNFNNNTVHFKIIYNATPDKFIKKTLSNGFNIDTSSNNWKIQ